MANQYSVDPRQALFLTYYLDFKSETFSNALQSALKAGYSQEYAENITNQMPDWLAESLGNNKRLNRAEKVLDEMLDMPVEIQRVEGYGEDKELVVKTEPSLVKIKQDTAKFIAERLGKEKYSTRSEISGKNGEAIEIKGINYVIPRDNNSTYTEATSDISGTEQSD